MELSYIILFGSLIGLLVFGVPVAIAMLVSALAFLAIEPMGSLLSLPQRMVNGIDSFILMAVPFFVLVGELMNRGGVTRRIFSFADEIVGHLRCGLGHVNILASIIFSGMSGSAVADTSGLGSVEMRAMNDAGYDKEFSAALTAASSTIGPLIPPSIPFVIYGSVTETSIGRLLLAGALPGLVLAALFMLLLVLMSRFRTFPTRERASDYWPRIRSTAVSAGPALLTPIILVGGIVFGIFTPTEASAVASLYAFVLGKYIYRELTWRETLDAFVSSAMISCQIMFIIAAAAFFGLVLAKAQIPQSVFGSLVGLSEATSPIVVLLVLNVALLVAGSVIDINPLLIIVVPILAPVGIALGIDPIHFGVIIVFNLMIGLLTPPVGMVTFTICRIADIRITDYSVALVPFFLVMVLALVVITLVPEVSLYIPNLIMGER